MSIARRGPADACYGLVANRFPLYICTGLRIRRETEMKKLGKLMIFAELWHFMRVRKKWWLTPIILMLVLIGLLAVFAQGSAFAPFIYALF